MGQEPTDHELLAAWRAGDPALGNKLVRRHFDAVYGFFASKVSVRPEDLVQRTFLLCLERADRLWAEASFRGFLFGIARRVLFKHYAELANNKGRVAIGDASIEELGASPSRVVAIHQEHKLLLAALRRVPVDFQITLELFYWEGATIEEIAQVLEVRPGTVKSRLARARGMLREEIEAMDVAAELRKSTLDGIDGWARSLKQALAGGGPEG